MEQRKRRKQQKSRKTFKRLLAIGFLLFSQLLFCEEDNKILEEEKIANETLKKALLNRKNKNPELENPFFNFEEKKEIALQIAQLRLEEAKKIYSKNRKKRIDLEKQLQIYNSFPVHSYIIKKTSICLIFIFIFVIGFIFILNSKKKIKAISFLIFLFVIPAIIYISLYSYFFKQDKYKTAIYIPKDKNSSYYIYHIPEETGTVLAYINIGETIIIKQQTNNWIFIEKTDGTGGWQKKENFLLCD